jgi:hypothetical protein
VTAWTLYPGPARLPDAASPDVRGCSYSVRAEVLLPPASPGGVLLSHGDRHAGYALHVRKGRLVHDYVHAGVRSTLRSRARVPVGRWTHLELRVLRVGAAGAATLLVDGRPVAYGVLPLLVRARTGYTGLDVGCDRGVPVGDYLAPARFAGTIRRVRVTTADDRWVDELGAMLLEGATG